ncbi:MAG: type 1 glutamine amidotransferase domain-containing protein [Pseudomonadota bacterium]
MMGSAVILLTSHNTLGDTGQPTGFHWVEMATPYYALKEAGYDVTLASVVGGRPPSDPSSAQAQDRPDSVARFMADAHAMEALEMTEPLSELRAGDYDIVYIPGGHGTMWDLAQHEGVGPFVAKAWEAGAVVGSVCHGPAALTETYLSDGTPLVKDKRLVAFTDDEEREARLETVVPYLLESRLRDRGAVFECNPEPFGAHVVTDGRLVTGQNPASVPGLADALVAAARSKKAAA